MMSRVDKRRAFQPRAFVSLTLAVGFLITMLAGLVLYITPQGRVANWTGWAVLGLGKEQWAAVHMTGSLLFVSMAMLHLVYNWKPLLAYLRRKARERTTGPRWEPVAALAVGLLFVVGTVKEWPPFQSVVAVNDAVKQGWEARAARAPQPHAEELSIEAYAEQLEMRSEGLLRRLREAGIEVSDVTEKLGSVAARHGLAPSQIHALVADHEPGMGMGQGAGRGRNLPSESH